MELNEIITQIDGLYYAENMTKLDGSIAEKLEVGVELAINYKSELISRAGAGMFGIDGTIEALAQVAVMNKLIRAIWAEQDAVKGAA